MGRLWGRDPDRSNLRANDAGGRFAVAALTIFSSLASSAAAQSVSSTQGSDVRPVEARVPPRNSAASASAHPAPAKAAPTAHFDIDDFVVEGADTLAQIEVEEAIYPFLGPNRTSEDVEKARAALEKAYHDKGFQTVSVAIPQQNVQGKVVVLKVAELKVGRLRVKNARYFDLDKIKAKTPSLKEGSVPNFGDVTKDIVALNQWPDRRVTPALRAGVAPGTVDVDLNVEDKIPLHANVELNNRRSPNTTALRVNATVHYDNLWQLGHSFSFTYQVVPQRPADAEVFSASYLARVPNVDWLSVLVYGLKSKSDVATVGGMNVVGPGGVVGARAVMTLPAMENLFHTISIGVDYKHFGETVRQKTDSFSSPITYYPLVASYGATYQTDYFTTQLNAAITFNMRTPSSDPTAFDNKRAYASGSFAHFNLDVSHTQELPLGFQAYGRVQGQIADGPLVSSEQFSLGGLDTVRGYLESEVLGDNGVAGNIELRSPNIGGLLQQAIKDGSGDGAAPFTIFNEWRIFGFADKGIVETLHPLSEQQAHFNPWSYGVGARFKVFDYVSGMVVYSLPMVAQTYTQAKDPHVNFRIWGEF
jgi:hemolysin activation/secretion protein